MNLDRRVSTTSSAPSATSRRNIRNALNPLATKEKMTPALKKALDVLNLKDFDALEHHFLSMIAFLKPWSHFRDAFLLLQPGSLPRSSEPGKVRGMDILWFYTNFSDGELRYDARADDTTSLFTTDETKYGNFDTTHWGVEEHEKMLYAWLLQEFKVGKGRNPLGFEYFELQNVCTAWKTVFVPIVEEVRASYDPRGRMHYGRLARFIELRHPSRVAFPEGNVVVPQSANPYRILSVPRERGIVAPSERLTQVASLTSSTKGSTVTKKNKIVLEQELRHIFPKYGQVVEKPKANLTEFLANQKARIKQKNRDIQDSTGALFGRNWGGRESPIFGCKGIDDPLEMLPSPKSSTKRSQKSKGVGPYGMYGLRPSPIQDKHHLHGVTRPLVLHDESSVGDTTQNMTEHLEMEGRSPTEPDSLRGLPKPAFARPDPERKASDGVYSSIRNSNPFIEVTPSFVSTPMRKSSIELLSPMSGHPSAIPKPLSNITRRQKVRQQHEHDLVPESPSPNTTGYSSKPSRMSSYAGTGYDTEIKPPFMANKSHSTPGHNTYDSDSRETSFALSEIPEFVYPLECQDRTTGTREYETLSENPETIRLLEGRNNDVPQSIPWPGMTPGVSPEPLAWPGQTPTATSPAPTEWPRASPFEYPDSPPRVPPKHPARSMSIRSSAGSDLPPPSIPKLLGPRIISKENIRGHLRNISQDIPEESLRQAKQRDVTPNEIPKLVPFNKNMFPRRDRNGTPVGAWMGNSAVERVNEEGFEMKPLEEQPKR